MDSVRHKKRPSFLNKWKDHPLLSPEHDCLSGLSVSFQLEKAGGRNKSFQPFWTHCRNEHVPRRENDNSNSPQQASHFLREAVRAHFPLCLPTDRTSLAWPALRRVCFEFLAENKLGAQVPFGNIRLKFQAAQALGSLAHINVCALRPTLLLHAHKVLASTNGGWRKKMIAGWKVSFCPRHYSKPLHLLQKCAYLTAFPFGLVSTQWNAWFSLSFPLNQNKPSK